jgi:hypothetical protein
MSLLRVNSESADEITPLVNPATTHLHAAEYRRKSHDAASIISSRMSRDELALADTAVGERLPYNAYTTIDWLHDLVCLHPRLMLPPRPQDCQLTQFDRSKMPFDTAQSNPSAASAAPWPQSGTA